MKKLKEINVKDFDRAVGRMVEDGETIKAIASNLKQRFNQTMATTLGYGPTNYGAFIGLLMVGYELGREHGAPMTPEENKGGSVVTRDTVTAKAKTAKTAKKDTVN